MLRRILSIWAGIVAVFATAACSDALAPKAPVAAPASDRSAAGTGLRLTFLPPIGQEEPRRGALRADVAPSVDICEWGVDHCAGSAVATFASGSSGDQAVVRTGSGDAAHFQAQWHAQAPQVRKGFTYRIAVRVNGTELGRAYVRFRSGAADADDGMLALEVGQTLPIKFRIEAGPTGPADSVPRLGVTIDPGVTGTFPTDTIFRRGARVRYRFEAAPGYENVLVMIDGHYAAPRGTIVMDGPHFIYAAADRSVTTDPGTDSLVARARGLLTAADPAAEFQRLLDDAAGLAARVGEDEAARRLSTAEFLAFDATRDEDGLVRLDDALANHVFYVHDAPAAARAMLARSESASGGPANPATVLYVNGILNTIGDAATTAFKLRALVGESNAANVTRVGMVYNRSLSRQITPADQRARVCMQDLARSRPFLSDLSLDRRFSRCMGSFYYLSSFDLAECFRQVMQLTGEASFANEADAKTIADSVLHVMGSDRQNVILVPHSQGNLMTEQALNIVHADPTFENGGGECLSVASIAAPTSQGWSLDEGRDLWAFIINHDVLDALLKSNTFQHIDTPLSRSADRELARWRHVVEVFPFMAGTYALKVVTLGLAIHSATDSYMSVASPESRTLLRENIETLATRNCHRFYALVGNYFASEPQYGCFSPLTYG